MVTTVLTSEDGIDGGGIVQVDARLARTENRDDAQGGVAARGEHKADVAVVLGERLDFFTEVVAEANHAVAVHVVTGRVNEDDARAALAHGLEPERDNRFRVAVEGLRAVHAFGGVAVAAAPETLDVERHDRCARTFDGLGIVKREGRYERGLGYFAFGENDDGFAVEERLVDFGHGGLRVPAVDVDEGLAVLEPALVPVGKRVAVTGDAERPWARHLQYGPVDKAEVRPHEKQRTRFRDVLHAHHLDAVAEHESESETERCAQKGHRVLFEVRDEGQREDDRENHEAVIEGHRGKDEQQRLAAHDEHEEGHLDHVCHGVDASGRVGARKVLDDGAQNDERKAGAYTDNAVEDALEPTVMHEREGSENIVMAAAAAENGMSPVSTNPFEALLAITAPTT